MLKIYFSGMEFDVDVAVRGSDALERTKQVLPHLIVLDIMLPDIDGYAGLPYAAYQHAYQPYPCDFPDARRMNAVTSCRDWNWSGRLHYQAVRYRRAELRVQGAIRASERESLDRSRVRLPAGRLIEEPAAPHHPAEGLGAARRAGQTASSPFKDVVWLRGR